MRRMLFGIAAVLICMAASAAEPPVPPETHQRDFYGTTVILDYSQIMPSGGAAGWLRAFVPTGSESPLCLVSLGDSGQLYAGPVTLLCIPRTFEGQQGVVVIIIPNNWTLPADLEVRVSVYQQGARHYGQPVLYSSL